MEADRRHTTTGVENLKSCLQSRLDLAELIVDGDSQALKRSRRDMNVARPGLARDRRLHGGAQIARGAERAPRHYELCDPTRPTLLPVLAEDPFELGGAVLIDDACRGELGARVHAHVQRSLGAEAEAALGRVELGAGDPEIEEDQVGACKAGGGRQLEELAESALDDCGGRPVSDKGLPPGVDCRGIAIDPKQPATWSDPLEDLAGVTRQPQGAVDGDRALAGFEQLYYFL
jgi:hypothetical protein